MCVIFAEEQHVAVAHELNNLWISLEHAEAGEVFDVLSESPRIINRTINFQAVPLSNHEVVVSVARRGVDQPGSGFAGG